MVKKADRIDPDAGEVAVSKKVDLTGWTKDELVAHMKEVEAAIAEATKHEMVDLRRQIVALASKAGMPMRDLLKLGAPPAKRGEDGKLLARYRHPTNLTITWSGRGGKPYWVKEWEAAGKSRDDLLIHPK